MQKILVVVDYQKDFVDGALGFEKAVTLENKIYNRVLAALENGEKVYFTLDTHDSNYLNTREGRHLPIVHCIKNSDGAKPYGRLAEFVGNDRITMVAKNCFGSLKLPEVIKAQNILPDEIEICGVVTNMCVIANAIILQSAYPDAELKINEAMCAGFDEIQHKNALDIMRSMHMKII